MILNRTYEFLFVHVPKTAGIAITRDLARFATDRDIQLCETVDRRGPAEASGLGQHSTAAEIKKAVGDEQFDPLFKFAFVRDPYARAYSLFRFLKFNFRRWENSTIMDSFETFDEFVASRFFQEHGPDRIFQPQTFWLVDDQGRRLVDRVARMEDLERELREIYATIGLPPVENVKAANVSGPRGSLARLAARLPFARKVGDLLAPPRIAPPDLYEIYAREETRCTVAVRYASDFEMFGYSPEIRSSTRPSTAHVAALAFIVALVG